MWRTLHLNHNAECGKPGTIPQYHLHPGSHFHFSFRFHLMRLVRHALCALCIRVRHFCVSRRIYTWPSHDTRWTESYLMCLFVTNTPINRANYLSNSFIQHRRRSHIESKCNLLHGNVSEHKLYCTRATHEMRCRSGDSFHGLCAHRTTDRSWTQQRVFFNGKLCHEPKCN